MRSRKQILQKMKFFNDGVKAKRKGKRMRLEVDNEFQQVKIKDLNDENNVAAQQKKRELKTRVAKLNAQKLKITPTKIIQNSDQNM